MSTESTRRCADLVDPPAARELAASVGKQVAAGAAVELRYLRAGNAAAREIARSTATEASPYSSFEKGGVRLFDRPAMQPPRFRIS